MFSSSRMFSSSSTNDNASTPSINPFNLSDFQKIGIGLALIGVLMNIFGILLFFDRGFIVIGNMAFIFGIVLLIGIRSAINFFVIKTGRLKGTISFFVGFLIIVYGHSIIGMMFEVYGYYVLFFNFIPTIVSYLSNIPVIGILFSYFNNNQRLPE